MDVFQHHEDVGRKNLAQSDDSFELFFNGAHEGGDRHIMGTQLHVVHALDLGHEEGRGLFENGDARFGQALHQNLDAAVGQLAHAHDHRHRAEVVDLVRSGMFRFDVLLAGQQDEAIVVGQ